MAEEGVPSAPVRRPVKRQSFDWGSNFKRRSSIDSPSSEWAESALPHPPRITRSDSVPVEFVMKRVMTPRQEVANAVSMGVPTLYLLYCWHTGGYVLTWCSRLVIIGSAVHSPLSMYYHMRVALSGAGLYPLRCPIDNTPRRLDQTGIHVLHCFAALALSGGCVAYTLAATLFNMSCIRLQWQQEVVPKRNQRNVFISSFLYLLPMVWRCDWTNLARYFTWAIPGVYCFVKYPLGGYSHAIFHVLLGGVLQALVSSTQSIVDVPAAIPNGSEPWEGLHKSTDAGLTLSPWWARLWVHG